MKRFSSGAGDRCADGGAANFKNLQYWLLLLLKLSTVVRSIITYKKGLRQNSPFFVKLNLQI